jgi:outer membrane murein-binding lipoprotein Lpp
MRKVANAIGSAPHKKKSATIGDVSDNGIEELRAQMQALAAEVDRLREESAQTRALAAMADRDAAEVRTSLRGHTQVLNALRETQLEQGRAFAGMAEAVGTLVVGQVEHGRVLADNSQTLAEHRQQLAALAEGQQAILTELHRISGND